MKLPAPSPATEAPRLPPIAVTLGDPAGIGPEILLKAALSWSDHPPAPIPLVAFGDVSWLEEEARHYAPRLRLQRVAADARLADLPFEAGCLAVVDAGHVPADLIPGQIDARAAGAARDALEAGIAAALAHRVSALVTAPIHKEAMAAAGVPYPGHTEWLADRAGGADVRMMLANDDLRVVLVTIHEALARVPALISRARVLQTLQITDEALRSIGIAHPRIAVAGLNPHAGEGGLMGREEIESIAPAIAEAQGQGIDARGPYSGDTVFMRARGFGEFDVVVAMYHDQGLIPIKYLGLDAGVNVTIGLPFIRTSVDHGTAFEIAGRGCADPASLEQALRTALSMALSRWGRRAA